MVLRLAQPANLLSYMNVDLADVRVGTSGFSFEDWKGGFYPPHLPKARYFDFYVTRFDTVEINVTYYSIPGVATFDRMVTRAPDGFIFLIKAHQSATHKREQMVTNTPRFVSAIQPVIDAGMLGGLLFQFPWSFTYGDQNRDHISRCRELFPDHPIFVEFRHDSWIRDDLFVWLAEQGIGYVSVDEPQLPHLVPPIARVTGDIGYVRLHGRNAEKWYGSDGQDRYDYNYSDTELLEWRDRVNELRNISKRVFVMFNNCRRCQATYNAMLFKGFYGTTPSRIGRYGGDLFLP